AVMIPAAMTGGLPALGALTAGAQAHREGKNVWASALKGTAEGALLSAIAAVGAGLPGHGIAVNTLAMGADAMRAELAKPAAQRDWQRVAAVLLVGGAVNGTQTVVGQHGHRDTFTPGAKR